MNELALSITGMPSISIPAGIPTHSLSTILSWAISLLFIIAIIMALGFMVWAGILWITSEGDKQKLTAARDSVKYTIVGLAIVMLSFLVINLIAYFFHVPLLGITPQ